MQLANLMDVADRIRVTQDKTVEQFKTADIITNCGHVRPITGDFADAIRPDAVVPLMFETWRSAPERTDVDLDLMRSRQVGFAGTNERHPAVDVFSYLGPMAVAQLADAGVAAYHGTIAVLCNNPFADYIIRGLGDAGATVLRRRRPEVLTLTGLDAVIVAITPTGSSALTAGDWPRSPMVSPALCFANSGAMSTEPPAGHRSRCLAAGRPRTGTHGCTSLPGRPGTDRQASDRRTEGGTDPSDATGEAHRRGSGVARCMTPEGVADRHGCDYRVRAARAAGALPGRRPCSAG